MGLSKRWSARARRSSWASSGIRRTSSRTASLPRSSAPSSTRRRLQLAQRVSRARGRHLSGRVLDVQLFDDAIVDDGGEALAAGAEAELRAIEVEAELLDVVRVPVRQHQNLAVSPGVLR